MGITATTNRSASQALRRAGEQQRDDRAKRRNRAERPAISNSDALKAATSVGPKSLSLEMKVFTETW
ncbi:hypothetical protein [Croceicoccus gelatinilyticus]|uniref:hypothetical protein n=1 Tax=Croceicoccus gelatinilyticus TaxID=2835536 RepID=UPI001BCB5A0B|nr:hypothetical protein [Croceicoccus gelatinilyticus]MBS7668249.1 hypothetical protein [Croceicoccus gelatinilyticus]